MTDKKKIEVKYKSDSEINLESVYHSKCRRKPL